MNMKVKNNFTEKLRNYCISLRPAMQKKTCSLIGMKKHLRKHFG